MTVFTKNGEEGVNVGSMSRFIVSITYVRRKIFIFRNFNQDR